MRITDRQTDRQTDIQINTQRSKHNLRKIFCEGKKIREGNRFEQLGEKVTGDGESEAEVLRRIQVGVNALRGVEGVIANR